MTFCNFSYFSKSARSRKIPSCFEAFEMSDNLKKAEPPKPVTGDGIRSLETSGVFRTLNFELYAKPNKFVMAFGLVAITGFHLFCV